MTVSAQQREQFDVDGAIVVRQVFTSDELELLARGMDRNFAAPSEHATRYTPDGEPGGFYDDYCNWQRIDEYREFIESSRAGAVAGELMGSQKVRVYHEHVLIKEPGTQEVTPWHHDQPYYGVEGMQLCSIWVPLDPVPLSACPKFVAGSHRWGKRFVPRMFVDHRNYGQVPAEYETVPDIDAEGDAHRILSWDLQPGDGLVFHMLTLHAAPNTLGLTSRRRGFSIRWLGDDAVFAQRPWPTSPPFPELDLREGEPLVHDIFPVIWSSPSTMETAANV